MQPTQSPRSATALDGRHALVTGGGRGIGAAIAERLAGLGASLTLVGRDRGRLEDEAARIGASGGAAEPLEGDVADADSLARVFSTARERFGAVAILVNNAGAARSAPFLKTDRALWDEMLAVNLTGAYLASQAALPDMLETGWGRIVNVASTAGLKGYAYVTAYTAAKHGLVGLTRALALETARKGVTVNAVCPGYTDTDLVADSVRRIVEKTGRSEADARAELAATNPQGRLVTPEEVAETVAFLCSEGASAITGQAIAVAGGEVM